MVFTTEGLFEVAIETGAVWDFEPTTTELRSEPLTN